MRWVKFLHCTFWQFVIDHVTYTALDEVPPSAQSRYNGLASGAARLRRRRRRRRRCGRQLLCSVAGFSIFLLIARTVRFSCSLALCTCGTFAGFAWASLPRLRLCQRVNIWEYFGVCWSSFKYAQVARRIIQIQSLFSLLHKKHTISIYVEHTHVCVYSKIKSAQYAHSTCLFLKQGKCCAMKIIQSSWLLKEHL